METDLGQASQDELNVVTAAMAAVAHDIKLETGDAIDSKLTVTDSKSFTVYPQASSAGYGDDLSLFSSYTSNADSEHGLGDQPLSMQVHFPTLQLASLDQTPPVEHSCPVPLTSSQPAVPFTNGQTSDLFAISETFDLSACSQPSVSSTSSQSSVPFTKFLPSVPLTSSQPSKSFSSQSVVSFTNSQSSTFHSSQRSAPVTSSQPSVPVTSSQPSFNCSQPSVPFTSSQPSVPVVSSQPSVPVTGSQPSFNCSQPSVPFTSSQPSVPVVSSQPSVPVISSQPSVPVTGSELSISITSSQPSVSVTSSQSSFSVTTSQPSAAFISSQPLIPFTNSQFSVPVTCSQPSVPFIGSQPSVPDTSLQPSVPCHSQPSVPFTSSQSLVSFTSSQPSAPSACPQPSLSATWYKQPSSVPLFHSRAVPSALSSVGAGQQASKAASQAARSATSSPPLAAIPTHESQRTRTDRVCRGTESAGEKGDLNGRVSVASSCRDVSENEDQRSEVMAQVLTQSGRLTRQAARACAERVERTTRRLRARQSAKTSPEKEKDTSSSTALEKPDASHVPSPLPNSQQLEMLPPAAQELKPRRMTRKPRHTQRVWRPDVRGEPFDKWRIIGQTQGLTNDTEIAVFLMQHYENAMSGQPSGICVNCQAVLTLTCTVCQSTSQPSETSITSLGVPSVHANMEHMEVKAKTEPVDPVHHDPSPQREIDVELQMGPDPEKEEPEEETAVFFEAEHIMEEQEEEEKPPTRQRKRGRPRGSGKKSAEKAGGPRMKAKANKYKCTYDGCNAAFAKSSRLKVHTRIHTGEKPYVCKDCGKAFTQKSGLTVHSQKHTGLRPFTCQECGTSFPSSSTLKQHMRRHTGEKPFVCKKCNKRFRWSGHLTQHLRMHDGIKPFLCPDCGKSFSASSDLAKHRVTHTKSRPYKCDRCDKAYSFQHRLTAHQRSHTGDRPFLCSECGAAFSRAHNLTVHMRTHTGDKPYWCKDCGAKFSDSGNFCKHKKTKHGQSTKNTPATKRAADTAEPVPDQPANLGGSRLLDYEFLVGMGRGGKSADATGKLPSIDKVAVSKMRKGRSPDTHRLPSMAKVASRAKLERDRRKGVALGGVALTSTPSLNSSVSLPTSLPADFKNILPPVGGDSLATSLPSHFSPIGSPPALPVQNRLSVSPAVSPVVSLPPPHGSPGPGVSNDSSLSAMTQSGHEMSEYQASQPDGVVFPPQYYGSYPYYCQQQE